MSRQPCKHGPASPAPPPRGACARSGLGRVTSACAHQLLVGRLHSSGCGGVRRVGRSGSRLLATTLKVKRGPRGSCLLDSTMVVPARIVMHAPRARQRVPRVVSPAAPFVVCAAAFSGSCAVSLPLLCSPELAVPAFGCCVLGRRVSTPGPASRSARAAEAWSAQARAVRVGSSGSGRAARGPLGLCGGRPLATWLPDF